MVIFKEANQVRLALKMKLSHYAWYNSSVIIMTKDGYCVVIGTKHIDNKIRKIIPQVIDGVSVKVEIDL